MFAKYGYEIHKSNGDFPYDFSDSEKQIIESVRPFTMTSRERCLALINAVRYVVKNNIEGDVVECGVWKGGSVMAVAKTLLELKNKDREIYLFDTFEGMPKPSEIDIQLDGNDDVMNDSPDWLKVELDNVKHNVFSTGYDKEKFHFIKGKVEDTIPLHSPKKISILRLDTDWYESTKHELIHLFPLLSVGGVLILDDYGFWNGARQAVDEYIEHNKIKILLNRIDPTGRIGIKLE